MKNAKKRMSLLVTLLCAFVLVLSLGIVSACGGSESASAGSWYYGEEIPTSDLGQEGDFYLNTETLKSYVKEGKAWREASSDDTGAKWYYGTVAPESETGSPNDFYLNTATGELYQKKGENDWGTAILSLKGKDGRDGVIWHSGEGSPVGKEIAGAQDGDFYLDTEDDKFDVYQLVEGTWQSLGAIKGKDAKDPVQFFNGTVVPEENEELAEAKEGDLYLAKFDGFDTEFAGSILYRKIGGEWVPLMENVQKAQVNIESREQLTTLAEKVAEGATYEGKEIHLKVSIDFNAAEATRSRRANGVTGAAEGWTPIGTADHPFMGTFDGEGHTISNFAEEEAGFFGHVKNATVKNLNFINVKAGSLVDTVEADSTVTVEQVKVEVADSVEHSGGNESNALVGSGDVTFKGSNEVGYPVVAGVGGFVEMHRMNGEDATVVYEISTAAGLAAFRDDVNKKSGSSQANDYKGKDVYLMEDIDLNNEEWTPIGSYYDAWVQSSELYYCYFRGNFHGNGHTISNLKISEEGIKKGSSSHPIYYPYAGLFGYLSGNGSVENLKLNGVNISGYMNVGAIAGYVGSDAAVEDCTVENVTITVVRTIDGSNLTSIRAGAVVGYSSRELTTCSSKNAKVNLEMSDGILKNIEYKAVYSGDYITSFDVESMEDFIAATEMINAKSSLLTGESVTMNLAAGEYDFAEANYTPVSLKNFTVEGNGAVIKNLNAANANGWAGLFGSIENCTVKNLVFEDATLEGCDVGVVAGKAINSTLEGITVKGNVNLSWVAKLEMDYSRSGIGLLTGFWDNKDANIAPEASLECNASINYGKIAYALLTSRPDGLIWADTTHYFGTVYSSYGSYVQPQTTGVVAQAGNILKTENYAERGMSLQVDDKITLGSYPQSKVEETSLVEQLNGLTAEGSWTEDNNKQYQDITLENGKKYRGVKNDDGSVEWFSFDPITWRVVENGDFGNKASYAKYTLLADCILDNQMQYSSGTAYPNSEWIYSWLDDTFTGTAFGESDSAQYKLLQTVHGQAVSLLPRSIAESFQNDWYNQSEKWLKGSDYAYCQGLDKDNPWWLSGNSIGDSSDVYMVGSMVVPNMDVKQAKYGVAPIICLGSEIGFLTFD